MYQKWLDGDDDITRIPKEEDPFWEPTEDVLIGTANVFLQVTQALLQIQSIKFLFLPEERDFKDGMSYMYSSVMYWNPFSRRNSD